MNKIYQLFDEKFITKYLKEKILPEYPDFVAIKKVEINPRKKYIWGDSYHVVVEFKTDFLTRDKKTRNLSIFCSAHHNEPRKNVYDALRYLWKNGFGKGYLSIPHALFYSKEFNGTFYRGAKGRNLYRFIREKNYAEIESIVPKAAAWFAKLHGLPTKKAKNFNKENSRIETVFPGLEHILEKIKHSYGEHYDTYKKLYDIFIENENNFLNNTDKRWFVHGDAHPENIIKMSRKKISVIDFTDICLSDFARDLGTFTQQIEYMCMRKIGNPQYSEKIIKLFLDNYQKNAKITIDDDIKARIKNYYYWTSIRTATFFLLKAKPEPERAWPLLEQAAKNLLN